MDLLALATTDSRLLVYRISWQIKSWQRLLTIAVDEHSTVEALADKATLITSMAWQPSGSNIAVGLRSGEIVLFSVENGGVVASSRPHECAVTSMVWAAERTTQGSVLKKTEKWDFEIDAENALDFQDRTERFFKPLPEVPPPVRYGVLHNPFLLAKGTSRAISQPQEQLQLLYSGDERAGLHISAFGTFAFAAVVVKPEKDVAIEDIAVSPSLGSMVLSLRSRATGAVVLARMDTPLFPKRRKELQALATQSQHISPLLKYVSDAMSSIRTSWSEASKAINFRVSALRGFQIVGV